MRNYSFHKALNKNGGPRAFYNGRPIRFPRDRGAYINPERFVNKATTQSEQANFVPQHQFKDFHLEERLQINIKARGYASPTPIQDAAIQPILEGKDLIGLANTGSGKTAAFLLPILHHLRHFSDREAAVLILVPTRELASQIEEEFKAFAWGLKLYSALCVGGASINRQIAVLNRRPQVIIGTPGRLTDLFDRKVLRLDRIRILVLDEVDRMLDMGFIKDIRFLVAQLPRERQSLCFSATMPKEIEHLTQELMVDPVAVSVKTGTTSEFIEQDVIRASSKEQKIEILNGLLRQPDFDKVLIFGRTKWGVQKLADSLAALGHTTASIHGNKSQPQRRRALQAFKEDRVGVLVATDVAARGLDIPGVSHVINFDQPNTYDDYIHRIGRTARAGKQGKALTFVSS
ncbi:MAG: DEAD/DEAH box helicase [Patescibacteria group bacterium]